MASVFLSFMYLFVVFSFKNSAHAERIRDKMYDPIEGAAACFRRLNGTHQFGCSSHRSGNVGVIHFIENQTDLEWLLNNATADPYMAVIQPNMFTKNVMSDLKNSGKVNGIVLVNNHSAERPNSFSHEDTCPNRYSGLSLVGEQTCNSAEPWNPHGTGLMQIDWGFPIFHVGDEGNISLLHECYLKHNAHNRGQQADRSLCALEMNSFMLAAVDSETCMRRSSPTTIINLRFCDPLGDRNIWSTLYPRYKEEKKNNTVYIVAARMDGTSMFDGLVPGAMSPVTGIVTLLMTARVLSSIAKNLTDIDSQQDKNVLFLLLSGESYDYIGSSRLVWDMQHGEFPLKWDSSVKQPPPLQLNNIAMFIELGQISTLGRTADQNITTLYCHQHNPSSNDVVNRQMVDNFIDTMNKNGEDLGLQFNRTRTNSLPPSSLQTFLAARRDLPGVVLTDHSSQYLNKYYHSIMDDSLELKYNYMNGSDPSVDSIQVLIAKLSQTLAQTLYVLMNDIKPEEVPVQDLADPKMVDKLLHCYLDTKDCPVFRAAANKQNIVDTKPASMYVGVNVWASDVISLTGHTLALLVNQTVNRTKDNCHNDPDDRVYQYFWMNNTFEVSNSSGGCIKTTMNYSLAISPAFVIPDYNWASGSYPTWTESVWREFSVRMFLKPSRSHENLTLSLGIVALLLSFLIVYFANSRSQILFGNPLVTSSC
ncbi:nicastrin isoform X2 [Periplaneta americana]|uniref:nicastrin isoform X2 n=1 Tax=Periplaneta americana TaxID=6978 RepID=UPI0037E8744C